MTERFALQAVGVTYRYANHRGVRDIHLQLQRGEVLGLLGLNGAGKSTTLRLLAGVLQPSAGQVRVAGTTLRPGVAKGRAQLGYLPEHAPCYPELTVDEQLRFAARLFGMGARHARSAAAAARSRCGLDAVARQRVQTLSQGMRRRLGLAQAIVHKPAVLLLDEPTVALDPAQIVQVRALITELSRDSAVVLSSHLLHEVETLCTRVAVLHQGRLVHEQALAARVEEREFVLALAHDPGPAAVAEAAGAAACTTLEPGRYAVQGDEELAAAMARTAVQQGWGLRELTPRAKPLEQRFLALTREQGIEPS